MTMQTLFLIAFLLIVASLGSALFYLTRHKSQEQSEKTVKALTVRISLSLFLFVLVFVALATGLIKPHGIGARMHLLQQQNQQLQP